jgi:hypothetical protein
MIEHPGGIVGSRSICEASEILDASSYLALRCRGVPEEEAPMPTTVMAHPNHDEPLPQTRSEIRSSARASRAAQARQASGRRRFVDPTTCDRDYSQAEMEFMQAMQQYKLKSGRMFPTWSEVLEVLRELGYAKSVGPSFSTSA